MKIESLVMRDFHHFRRVLRCFRNFLANQIEFLIKLSGDLIHFTENFLCPGLILLTCADTLHSCRKIGEIGLKAIQHSLGKVSQESLNTAEHLIIVIPAKPAASLWKDNAVMLP